MTPLYNKLLKSSSSSSSGDLALGLCAAAAAATTTTAITAYYYFYCMEEAEKNDLPQHFQQVWNELKDYVRSKISTVIQQIQHQHQALSSSSSFTVTPIGTVRSIYQLCVGTPRQGLLTSHTRGHIELLSNDPWVEGLQDYSHIWVIFVFHLNTTPSGNKKTPAKIAPPALGGKKVGVLATRSPHRPNPIGMTLCKLESISTSNNKKTILHLSGLDLVDGTPVLDIKPFVSTYDSVPSSTVPSWVTSGLKTKRRVIVRPEARYELQQILNSSEHPLEFYGGRQGESTAEALESILLCIEEVLAVDVRSSWQTGKVRKRQSQAERASRLGASSPPGVTSNEFCTQQLDQLLLSYTVEPPSTPLKSKASRGSGAEDIVTVHSIELLSEKQKADKEQLSATEEEKSNFSIPQAVTNLFSSSTGNKVVEQQQTDADYADKFVDPKEPVVSKTTQRELHSDAVKNNDQDKIMASPPPNNNTAKASSTPFFLSPDVSEMTSPMVLPPASPPPSAAVLKVVTSPTKPPEDEENYHVLKDYWHQAAAVNTPNGMKPSDEYFKKTGLTSDGRVPPQSSLTQLKASEELSDISNSFDEVDGDEHDGPPQPPQISRKKQQEDNDNNNDGDDDDEPVLIS